MRKGDGIDGRRVPIPVPSFLCGKGEQVWKKWRWLLGVAKE